MPSADATSRGRRSSVDRWVLTGAILVGIGVMATAITLVPWAAGADPLPLAFYLASFAAPLGLALIGVSLLRRGRARSRVVRSGSDGSVGGPGQTSPEHDAR